MCPIKHCYVVIHPEQSNGRDFVSVCLTKLIVIKGKTDVFLWVQKKTDIPL